MLSRFAFDVVHVGLQFLKAFRCKRTAVYNHSKGSMSAVFKIVIVEVFSFAAAVNVYSLTAPANLSVRL